MATLAVSLFVLGLGLGPLLLGPVSEVYGRNIVYRLSYGLLFAFSWPIVFPPNAGEATFAYLPAPSALNTIFAAVYLVFRFITGLCGSAFMSVVGGSVADMFSNAKVGKYVVLLPPLSPSLNSIP